MILNDVMILENIQVLNEGKSGGPMKIRGVFQRADEANKNNRIYSKAILEREMQRLGESIASRSLLGELDHPMQYDNVKLSNVSHLVTKLEMKGSEMIGEAEILGTPAGQIIKSLIEGGVAVGISSRGSGSLSEDAQGNKFVNEDFKLTTFDLVADPSTRGAYPSLAESTLIENIVSTTCRKAVREKVFITMLKDKLDEWNSDGPLAKLPSTKSKAKASTEKLIGAVNRKRAGINKQGDDDIIKNSDGEKAKAAYLAKKKSNTDFLNSLMSNKKKKVVAEGSLKDRVKKAARERSRGEEGRHGQGFLKSRNMAATTKKSPAQRAGYIVSHGKHGFNRSQEDPVSIKTKERILRNQAKRMAEAEAQATQRRGETTRDQIRRRLLTSRVNPNSKLNSRTNLQKEIERMRAINRKNK